MVTQEIMRWVKEWVAGWTRTRFFGKSDHQLTSRGAASSGYPIVLDSTGKVDASFIDDADIDHGNTTGRGDDDHSQYALLAGRSGGQTLYGGTAANDDITIHGTSNATRTTSYVLLQPTAGNVGIGTTTPTLAALQVVQNLTTGETLRVYRNLASASTDSSLFVIHQDNVGDDQTTALIRNDGTGNILDLYDDATLVVTVKDGGNVGIGTTAPSQKQHTKDSANIYQAKLQANSVTADAWGGLGFSVSTDDAGAVVAGIRAIRKASSTDVDLDFRVAGDASSLIYLDASTLRVGIANPAPDSVFHTVGTNAQTGGWTLESSAGTDADRLAIYPVGNFSVIAKLLSANGTWQFLDSSGNCLMYMESVTGCTVFGGIITPGASGALAVVAGASTNDAAVGGTLYSTVTSAGNVTTGEDTLATYTVPANTLSVNNMSLRFEAWGATTNNANTKTIKVKFDGVIFGQRTMTTSAANTWVINGQVQRTGAATQTAFAKFVDGGTTEVDSNVGLTSTLSNAIVFLITGEGTSTNDITLYGLRIWWEDANT